MIEESGNPTLLDHVTTYRTLSATRMQQNQLLSQVEQKPEEVFHPTYELNPGRKRTEVGFLSIRKPMTVYLYSERFPIGLLALDVAWCRHLVIVGVVSLTELLLGFLTNGEQEIHSTQPRIVSFNGSS